MARKLRIQYPDAIYHVMNRGDRREPILRDDLVKGSVLTIDNSGVHVSRRRQADTHVVGRYTHLAEPSQSITAHGDVRPTAIR